MDSNACTRVIDLPSPSTLTLSLLTTLFTIDCERFMHGWACVGQALAPTRRERILLDGSATIHHVNLAWQHKFGYRSSDLVGTRMHPLQVPIS